MRATADARSRMLRTTFHALLVANAACGLDAIGTSPDGSETMPDAETPGGDDGTPPGSDAALDGGSTILPEADGDIGPEPDAADVEDAADGATSLYRDDWFNRTGTLPLWGATWWKPDTCRDKPGQIGSVIGPKIIQSGTRQEVSPQPPADRSSVESELVFPREGSIWPTTSGVPDIAEATGPLGNGPTNAFCALFQAPLSLPPGKYKLHYEVSDSLVVYVDQTLVAGPKWFDSILNSGYGDQNAVADLEVPSTPDSSHDVRVYYNNANKSAVLKLRLEGPLEP